MLRTSKSVPTVVHCPKIVCAEPKLFPTESGKNRSYLKASQTWLVECRWHNALDGDIGCINRPATVRSKPSPVTAIGVSVMIPCDLLLLILISSLLRKIENCDQCVYYCGKKIIGLNVTYNHLIKHRIVQLHLVWISIHNIGTELNRTHFSRVFSLSVVRLRTQNT